MRRVVQALFVVMVLVLTALACGREETAAAELSSSQAELTVFPSTSLYYPPIPTKVRVAKWVSTNLWSFTRQTAVNIVGRSAKTPGVLRLYGVDPSRRSFAYCYEIPDSEHDSFSRNLFYEYAAMAPKQSVEPFADGGMPPNILGNGAIDDEGGPGGSDPGLNVRLMDLAADAANAIH